MAQLQGDHPKMDWGSHDLPTAFAKFKTHADFMFGGPLSGKTEEVQCNYLMLWVGEKGRNLFSTWTLTDEQKKQKQTYFTKFEEFCKPKSNQIYARFRLKSRTQADTESFDQFVTELRLLAKDCGYGNREDEMVRDHLVFGIKSTKIREKLIQEGTDLTLDKAIDISRTYELSQQQSQEISKDKHPTVHTVKRGKKHGKQPRRDGDGSKRGISAYQDARPKFPDNKCGNCGQTHQKGQCPAQGKLCSYCNKLNHYQAVCRKRKMDLKKKHTHQVTGNASDSDSSQFFVDSIEHNQSLNQAFASINIGPKQVSVKMKIDSGSQVNILPLSTFSKLGLRNPLKKCSQSLLAYNGHKLDVRGTVTLQCTHKGTNIDQEFFVVRTNSCPILGLDACLSLDLLRLVLSVNSTQAQAVMTKESVLSEFKETFRGIGDFPGECTIHLNEDAVPKVHPPRRVPVTIRDKLKIELDKMETLNVITKVTEPTEWVNSLVTVEKSNGSLRICLDPKDLNEAIKRPHYPMKTLEDVLPELANARYFSKLDAKSGYWALKLDRPSSYLTTFNSPFGRYRFLRLPFGLKSSQDEFQRKIDESLEGLSGVTAIVDDILVYGIDRQDHDRKLRDVLFRCRERGIKLNPDKLEVGLQEIHYFGHVLSADGLKPDPSKVSAIRDMKPPVNKQELETFLGMVTYLSKFAPNLSDVTTPLRKLLSKDTEFVWDHIENQAFLKVKSILTNESGQVLKYFDPSQEITIQCDASKHGIGCCLLQNDRPVAYASKTLTPTEQNYAQIEKELYAVLFSVKRFHQYVYGKPIRVQSDHKPLVAILRKPLHVAPPRLQRMLLQLQKYDIDLYHSPGKDIPVADALSRKSLPDTYPEYAKGLDTHVHSVMRDLPVSDQKMKLISHNTETDRQFQSLKSAILDGWPNSRKQCPSELHEYWNFRDELTFIDGVILKGHRIVIPASCREQMLQKIHDSSHLGVEKCLQRARDTMFWPNISNDVKNTVLKCTVCLERRNNNPKQDMSYEPIPDRPWQVLATDMFTFDNFDYVLLTDYYSNFFEIGRLKNARASTVINKLKSFMSRHGIPEKVVSDNGPAYSSQEFEQFASEWDFRHVTSSPLYPQSNGLAERTVGIVKNLLKKAKADGQDPYLAILEYRNTPLACGQSPSQLLMSRRLKASLPVTSYQLNPKVTDRSVLEKKISHKQKQKHYYDKSARSLQTLQLGEAVRIKRNDLWKPAIVTKVLNNRSYIVETEDGGSYRRNRRHLLKSNETPFLRQSELNDIPLNLLCSQGNTTPALQTTPDNNPNTTSYNEQSQNSLAADKDVPSISPAESPKGAQSEKTNYVTRSGRTVKPVHKLNL